MALNSVEKCIMIAKQGYPGAVDAVAEYRLVGPAVELRMRASAAGAATPINLAQAPAPPSAPPGPIGC